MADHEAIVVGASIAGGQVALRLARAGVPVCVLESRREPHAKVCGEGLHPAGRALLEEVLGEVGSVGVPLHGFEFSDVASLLRMGHPTGEFGLGCDRLLLERALWTALAEHPGVEFRSGVTVRGVRQDSGSWLVDAGDDYRTSALIAADGVHSRVRRWAGRDSTESYGRWGLRQRFHARDLPSDVHISFRGDGEVFITPLPGDRVSIAVLGDEARIRSLRDPAALRSYLDPVGALHGAVPIGRAEAMPHCGRDASVLYRDGLFLAGDAAVFLDPISGAGMTLASISAKIVADAVVSGANGVDVQRRAEREFRRLVRPYRQLTWFLYTLARSTPLRRSATAVLRRVPRAVALLSRPTTAEWATRATATAS